MRTTIDKAGRFVIPSAARDRLGLTPGTALEVSIDETGLRLDRVAPGPQLMRVGKRLVASATVPPDDRPAVDVAALVEEERNGAVVRCVRPERAGAIYPRRPRPSLERHGLRPAWRSVRVDPSSARRSD